MGLIDLFAKDVAVPGMPRELFDHGEQGPPHAHGSLGRDVYRGVEVEARGDSVVRLSTRPGECGPTGVVGSSRYNRLTANYAAWSTMPLAM